MRSLHQNINEVTVADQNWPVKHWSVISNNYRAAPYFSQYERQFKSLFLQTKAQYLSEINYRFLSAILEILGVKTNITWSTDYTPIRGRGTERIVNLCRAAGATCYLSGPAAKVYLQTEQFAEAGIDVEYMDYTQYPEYRQLYPPFDHAVSIIDVILMCGLNASYYVCGWRGANAASQMRAARTI